MNLITMVPATARFIAQMRGMRRHIVENNVTEFAVFQNWCDENNERWAEALDSGCAIAIEKFIADWNGRADANRWKHAAQSDDNIWDKGDTGKSRDDDCNGFPYLPAPAAKKSREGHPKIDDSHDGECARSGSYRRGGEFDECFQVPSSIRPLSAFFAWHFS